MSRLLIACLLVFSVHAQPLQRVSTWPEAEKLEADSAAHPDDAGIRVQLMRFYFQNVGQSADRVKPLLRKHTLWMIEHHPENGVLSGGPAADSAAFAEQDAAWRKQLSAPAPLADTFANAAGFYKTPNAAFARQTIENGLKIYPGNARIMNVKGQLLANSIAGVTAFDSYGRPSSFQESDVETPEAAEDRKELELTTDTNLLGGAAQALMQQLQSPAGHLLPEKKLENFEALVVHLNQRAMKLDPNSPRWASNLMNAYQSMAALKRTPAEKIALLEKALNEAAGGDQRGYVLTGLAEAYFNAGDLPKAREAATELVNTTGDDKSNWNYGNAIHAGNIVLGRIALKEGDEKEAANRLLAAGRTPGSPQLNSFGPNWTLAQDLLAKGDRTSVLSFLDECRVFWTSGRTRLESLAAAIRSGGTPNFSGPAEFPRTKLIGKAAPDFRLKDLKGGEVSLADFKGKVVLLDFWATWCGPCRQEMPDFEKIHRELGTKDVVVLALDANETQDTVAPFIQKEKYTFGVLLSEGTDVVSRYSVNAYPTTFAIDKSGRVAEILIGSGMDSASRLHEAIEKARAGAPAPAPDIPAASAAPAATTADDFYRDAIRLRNGKDLVGSIKAFDAVLEKRPDWLAALTARANLYSQLKQYDHAIADLNKAIELDPKRAAIYDQRGLAYSNSGRHAQAIPDYTRAIEIEPGYAAAWNNRGWAYLDLGQFDRSLADLNKAIELNPAYTTALYNRAHLYSRRKEYALAVADFDAILRVAPTDSQASSQKAEAQRFLKEGAGTQARLAAPKLLSPPDGAVFDHFPRETTLVWSEVPGAAGYVAEWDFMYGEAWNAERPGHAAATISVNLPVATIRFVGAQPGRWRVWALDASGSAGPKSEWREFRYTK